MLRCSEVSLAERRVMLLLKLVNHPSPLVSAGVCGGGGWSGRCVHFTCWTGTNVRVVTHTGWERRCNAVSGVDYWAGGGQAQQARRLPQVRTLLVLLGQGYKY